ncbi:RHS repeat-associated core domain-containing protein [Pseudomonas sp. PB3P13]
MRHPPVRPSVRYQYDAIDRLVSRLPAGQQKQDRFYQKDQMVTDIQGAVQHRIFQCQEAVLAELHMEGIRRILLLMTDKQRSVMQSAYSQFRYTPYGHRTVQSGLPALFGYNGECPDPHTGHYLLGNGHRAFNPSLMRFNSSDSLSPFGDGGLNCYAYCSGDPVNRSDPTGRSWYGWAWFLNSAVGFAGEYLVRFTPKSLVSGFKGKAFGGATSAMASVGGLGASVLYLAMNRIEAALPDSPANDPLFYAFLTASTFGTLSGAGYTLHKLARRGPKTPQRLDRAMSAPNIGRSASTFSRAPSTVHPSGARLARSQSQPDIGHDFGSNNPRSASNTNLQQFDMRRKFEAGAFRHKPLVATQPASSTRIRQLP